MLLLFLLTPIYSLEPFFRLENGAEGASARAFRYVVDSYAKMNHTKYRTESGFNQIKLTICLIHCALYDKIENGGAAPAAK